MFFYKFTSLSVHLKLNENVIFFSEVKILKKHKQSNWKIIYIFRKTRNIIINISFTKLIRYKAYNLILFFFRGNILLRRKKINNQFSKHWQCKTAMYVYPQLNEIHKFLILHECSRNTKCEIILNTWTTCNCCFNFRMVLFTW